MSEAPMLFVDDSPEDVELALAALAAHEPEASVKTFGDAQRALGWLRERAREGADLPYVILLDWKMPGMGGRDFLSALRATAELAAIPVVVFTTSLEPRDQELAHTLGANAFVRKPDRFEMLAQTLLQVTRFWRLHAPPSVEVA